MDVWQIRKKRLPMEAIAFSRQKPNPEMSSFHGF
jgi:hypothetical protein